MATQVVGKRQGSLDEPEQRLFDAGRWRARGRGQDAVQTDAHRSRAPQREYRNDDSCPAPRTQGVLVGVSKHIARRQHARNGSRHVARLRNRTRSFCNNVGLTCCGRVHRRQVGGSSRSQSCVHDGLTLACLARVLRQVRMLLHESIAHLNENSRFNSVDFHQCGRRRAVQDSVQGRRSCGWGRGQGGRS